MPPEPTQRLLPVELPLMYVAAHRSLAYLSAELDDLSVLDRLMGELPGGRGSVRASSTHQAPETRAVQALLAVDVTDPAGDRATAFRQLSAVRGCMICAAVARARAWRPRSTTTCKWPARRWW